MGGAALSRGWALGGPVGGAGLIPAVRVRGRFQPLPPQGSSFSSSVVL